MSQGNQIGIETVPPKDRLHKISLTLVDHEVLELLAWAKRSDSPFASHLQRKLEATGVQGNSQVQE